MGADPSSTDAELVAEMQAAISRLEEGRSNDEWRYVNLSEVLDEVDRIGALASDPQIFLPVLESVRQLASDQIENRWNLLQYDRTHGIQSRYPDGEWSKQQQILQNSTHVVVRTLVHLTGAPPAYVDTNYEPERKTKPQPAAAKPPGKKRWWKG